MKEEARRDEDEASLKKWMEEENVKQREAVKCTGGTASGQRETNLLLSMRLGVQRGYRDHMLKHAETNVVIQRSHVAPVHRRDANRGRSGGRDVGDPGTSE